MKLIAALVLTALLIPSARAEPLKAYTLTLSANEIGYIARQLRERPFGEVADMLNKMQAQIDAQDKEAKEKAEKPKGVTSKVTAPN